MSNEDSAIAVTIVESALARIFVALDIDLKNPIPPSTKKSSPSQLEDFQIVP